MSVMRADTVVVTVPGACWWPAYVLFRWCSDAGRGAAVHSTGAGPSGTRSRGVEMPATCVVALVRQGSLSCFDLSYSRNGHTSVKSLSELFKKT